MSRYTMAQIAKVVDRAVEVAEARQEGKSSLRRGGQTFDLEEGGMCCRFVRQCFETAMGLKAHEWGYDSANAHDTLAKLSKYKLDDGDKLLPGDILGWPGNPGHIAIYVGNYYEDGRKLVAENTSNNRRGFPSAAGTKITRLTSMRPGWSAYRLGPSE